VFLQRWGKENQTAPIAPDVKNTRPVTLTSRRRVRSPDWRRELRHAQKGRGAENEAGQGGGASRDKKGVWTLNRGGGVIGGGTACVETEVPRLFVGK